MLRSLALLFAATLVPSTAMAGLGTSYGVGLEMSNFGGGAAAGTPVPLFPSLDLRFDPVLVQFYPLDLMWHLADENIVLAGAVVFTEVVRQPAGGRWDGVVQPGAHVTVADFGGMYLQLNGLARVGVESGSTARVGAYVVPSMGFAYVEDDIGIVAGGRLEMSVWF